MMISAEIKPVEATHSCPLGYTCHGENFQNIGTFESGDSSNDARGNNSVVFGFDNIAKGGSSAAFGAHTIASGYRSAAFGVSTIAAGENSVAFGYTTTAQPRASFVIGQYNEISGDKDNWIVKYMNRK